MKERTVIILGLEKTIFQRRNAKQGKKFSYLLIAMWNLSTKAYNLNPLPGTAASEIGVQKFLETNCDTKQLHSF